MAEEKKKPDYTDMDWSWLIRDREEKWGALLQQAEADHWPIIPLRKTENFTSQLILLPIQAEKRGIFIVCPGGGFMFWASTYGAPDDQDFLNRARWITEEYDAYGRTFYKK